LWTGTWKSSRGERGHLFAQRDGHYADPHSARPF
jgi:hypothetical protein